MDAEEGADVTSGEERLQRWLRAARYEVIPMKGLDQELEALPPHSVVAVTCPPDEADGISRGIEVARKLLAMGHRVVPHLAARVVRDKVHLADTLAIYGELGIDELIVIAGDEPKPVGVFEGALGVLEAMADMTHTIRSIGVSAYPERRHPHIPPDVLEASLKAKAKVANYYITQISFKPQEVVDFLRYLRGLGITLPVEIGVPGVVERPRLESILQRIGIDKEGMGEGDVFSPEPFLRDLAELVDDSLGVHGLKLNSFNRVANTEKWREALLHTVPQ
jgi:methylenetetrahydrofolate reductase (NADPH)